MKTRHERVTVKANRTADMGNINLHITKYAVFVGKIPPKMQVSFYINVYSEIFDIYQLLVT
ncbi:hypothetical protein T11_4833 [Trichinella zimbabwensis]|uniref:Uncharacterized protein n=1 Tax=Trichinella zimbabwensis TaxID=268475 RepID=A0A0V1GMK1_9BILA|nr:hypothetical protein T11_4833 [Trichinella zimbabwensis]